MDAIYLNSIDRYDIYEDVFNAQYIVASNMRMIDIFDSEEEAQDFIFELIGGASNELVISKDRLKLWSEMDLIIDDINDLIEGFSSLNPLMDFNPALKFNALGGWIDEKGDLIIEVSQGVKDTMQALRLGIKRKQKSIYHLERGELISLDEIRALIEEDLK